MSHITQGKGILRDLAAVKATVEALGGVFHEGQRHYHWYGRFVGDTPMPVGMRREDLGKCDHAARFKGASYEVGFRKEPDGSYRLAWDYYGPGGLMPIMGDREGGLFMQRYNLEVAKRSFLKRGQRILGEERRADGSIELLVAG